MKPAGWLSALLFLVLGACAGRPANVMLPVGGSAPGTRQVSLLVATTRRPLADPATLFGGDRSLTTSFVDIGVSIPPNHRVGELEWPDPRARRPGNAVRDRAGGPDRPGCLSRLVAQGGPAQRPAPGAALRPRLQQPLRRGRLPLRADRRRQRFARDPGPVHMAVAR